MKVTDSEENLIRAFEMLIGEESASGRATKEKAKRQPTLWD